MYTIRGPAKIDFTISIYNNLLSSNHCKHVCFMCKVRHVAYFPYSHCVVDTMSAIYYFLVCQVNRLYLIIIMKVHVLT